jgi:hypothetical protein
VACTKAGKAAPGLIRHGLPKVLATGERRWTFKLPHQKTQTQRTPGLTGRGHPDTRPAGKSSARHVSGRPQGEENHRYPVIAQLNDRWWVITCKNSIQWILQTRRGSSWRSRFFFRTRAGLLAFAREHASPIDGDALAILLRLPERIGAP